MEHERATTKRVYWCIKPTIAVLILMLTVPAMSTPSAGQAPVDDEQLEQYAELKKELTVSIIPAGYNIYSPAFIQEGIKSDAWDAARFDATVVGGITQALQLLMIANEAGLPIEFQSWGHSLTQATNLHLMLANERTQFFEAPMPKTAFEFGMKNGNLLNRGRVFAPKEPGLGLEIDWSQLTQADFYRSSVH